jgi:hypothetical protein
MSQSWQSSDIVNLVFYTSRSVLVGLHALPISKLIKIILSVEFRYFNAWNVVTAIHRFLKEIVWHL